MDSKSRKTLEFDRVRAILADKAASTLGRELAEDLAPSGDFATVAARQAETGEAFDLLAGGDRPPFGGVTDIRPALGRAERGGVLEATELRAVAELIRAARRLRTFLRERGDRCPGLLDEVTRVEPPEPVAAAIRRAITDEAAVADDASPKLAALRRRARTLGERIRAKLNSYLRDAEAGRALQEPLVTVREGRLVLPVRQDSRGAIPGVVHDVSASGATVYVEPMACVNMNNDLREAEAGAAEEERRILAALSALVGDDAAQLRAVVAGLAQLDFAFAKGHLALAGAATAPRLVQEPRLSYPAARHPLLPASSVVPVDVRLGDDFSTLVITGPNTGGKTVTLKTVGLLSLMVQSGLYIPAGDDAVATVWDEVLADVGDEQSIEQNLSTFSSHMTNIIRILGLAGERSLVLLDEIGAGTDPLEGAALATALLEELRGRGCRTVATTHYGQLKEFAHTHPGVANGSVSFDPETLAPTYRLSIGVPGPSNALAIARRLGLERHIGERAEELIGEDRVRVEELIKRLVADRDQLAAERQEHQRLSRQANASRLEAEARLREQEEKYQQALAKVRGELRGAVNHARDELARLIKSLRATSATEDRGALERELTAVRERFQEIKNQAEQQVGAEPVPPAAPGAGLAAAAVRPGLLVRIERLGQTGRVLAPPDSSGQVPVQVGIMRVVARLAELAPAVDPELGEEAGSGPKPGGRGTGATVAAKAQTFSPEINLRGQIVEEALASLDKYLDDAVLAGASSVRIIHGKGTGALREAVAAHLKRHPGIEGLRLAPPNQGGDGVTIATLR